MRKLLLVGAAFLLITGPGAVDAWLSLIDRFVGRVEGPVKVSIGDWYEAIFPILGLGILVGVVLWKGGKQVIAKEHRADAPTDSPTESSSTVPLSKETQAVDNSTQKNYTPKISSTLIRATASELTGIYKGITSIEAEPVVARYVGKLIVFDGEVRDVSVKDYGQGGYTVVLREKQSEVSIFANFVKDGNEDIRKLQHKQIITILGSIRKIEKYGIILESCSLATGLDA